MQSAIAKILLQILADEKNRNRLLLLLASVLAGLFGMLVMLFWVLSVMGGGEPYGLRPPLSLRDISPTPWGSRPPLAS